MHLSAQFKCCGQHTHLRLLAKELGRKKTRRYLAELYEILQVNESSHAGFTTNNGQRQLIVKARREQDRLIVTAVYWQQWFHISPKTAWWIGNALYVARFLLKWRDSESA